MKVIRSESCKLVISGRELRELVEEVGDQFAPDGWEVERVTFLRETGKETTARVTYRKVQS